MIKTHTGARQAGKGRLYVAEKGRQYMWDSVDASPYQHPIPP